ncbi:hypothetical protein [Bartonella tamiae]|uniref:HTH cro/C1-type domain-containing protein n=1 Tax=Bartonella tamiae Th239 TaxID=1094558 RepID=J0R7I7_9HYPH|nr:hypothetical protein [Bartonella tamiae]EJF91699.1 hypothetical protein ME5_00078 [Bartonella tamiae Th239]
MGLNRPLRQSELGRAIRLQGKTPGQSIRLWENGHTKISGPASACIDMMLNGSKPPEKMEVIILYQDGGDEL